MYTIEQTYSASSEKVWEALTDPDQMEQWYFKLKEFRPEKGFEFEFTGCGTGGEEYIHDCRVTEADPGKMLRHTWNYRGKPGASELTWELFPEGEQTRVRLTHTGLESFAGNGPDFTENSFKAGWEEITGKLLRKYLEGEKS